MMPHYSSNVWWRAAGLKTSLILQCARCFFVFPSPINLIIFFRCGLCDSSLILQHMIQSVWSLNSSILHILLQKCRLGTKRFRSWSREDRSCSGCHIFLKGNIDCQSESTWSPQFGHWRAQIVVLSVRVHYPKEPLRGERVFLNEVCFLIPCCFQRKVAGLTRTTRQPTRFEGQSCQKRVNKKSHKLIFDTLWTHVLKKCKRLAHLKRSHSILTRLSHALQFYFCSHS